MVAGSRGRDPLLKAQTAVVAAVLLAVVLAGCQAPVTQALEGRWQVEEKPVRGTVHEVHETPWGTWVGLDGATWPDDACDGILVADPPPRVGEAFADTVRFERVTYNGDPGIAPTNMLCPLPHLPNAIASVLSEVAFMQGGVFLVASSEPGITVLELVTRRGATASPDDLTLRLLVTTPSGHVLDRLTDWNERHQDIFVDVSSWNDAGADATPRYEGSLPGMAERGRIHLGTGRVSPSSEASTQHATPLEWQDDGDGRVGTGDRLVVRFLPRAGNWSTVGIVGAGYGPVVVGTHLFVLDPQGRLVAPDVQFVQFRVSEDTLAQPIGKEILHIGRVVGPSAVDDIEVRWGAGENETRATLKEGGSGHGIAWRYEDADADGSISTQDALHVEWSAPGTWMKIIHLPRNEVLEALEFGG